MASTPLEFLEGLCARYSGAGLIARLRCAAERGPADVQTRAREVLVSVLKEQTLDVAAYRAAASSAGVPADLLWCEASGRAYASQLQALDREATVQSGLGGRDNMRRAYLDGAQFLLRVGAFSSASDSAEVLKRIYRAREYSINARHIVDSTLLGVQVACLARDWTVVSNGLARAEVNAELSNAVILGKVRAAQGLVALSQRDFASAAQAFAAVPLALGTEFAGPLHVEDAGVLGALCAAASLQRDALHTLSASPCIKAALEGFPLLRSLIRAQCDSSGLAPALAAWRALAPLLACDPALTPDTLRALEVGIRRRGLALSLAPFSALDVRGAAAALAAGAGSEGEDAVRALEAEVSELVLAGAAHGRIDALAHTFATASPQSSTLAHESVASAATLYLDRSCALLLRGALERGKLVVRATPKVVLPAAGGTGGGFTGGAPSSQLGGGDTPGTQDAHLVEAAWDEDSGASADEEGARGIFASSAHHSLDDFPGGGGFSGGGAMLAAFLTEAETSPIGGGGGGGGALGAAPMHGAPWASAPPPAKLVDEGVLSQAGLLADFFVRPPQGDQAMV